MSRYLDQPTPGKIKKASKFIIRERDHKNDLHILSTFFNKPNDTNFILFLNKIDADKFKAVQNFLLGETKNPEEDLIEFVAWLIDFQPRPYSEFRKK